VLPGWFVVVFLLFVIVQLFGINSLDLYSSGVTLQALGLRLQRSHAVLLDSVIALLITLWAVLNAHFSTYLKDFVGIVIVWIAPWCAIFLADWVLRRYDYVAHELQKSDASSLYWSSDGFNLAALGAQLLGMLAALSALNTSFSIPGWLHPLTVATESDAHLGALSGADFSVFFGFGVGALSYALFATLSKVIVRQTPVLETAGSPELLVEGSPSAKPIGTKKWQ
jgi:purine-cytosine permease-like protein